MGEQRSEDRVGAGHCQERSQVEGAGGGRPVHPGGGAEEAGGSD